MKNYQYFILIILILNMVYQKKKLFCYRFMFKYLKMYVRISLKMNNSG
jgi:hypothetical protein